jgi:hypothetical protein
VRFNAISIIFLSIAWACLTIGAFTFDPRSIVGIIFLCLGLFSLCIAIVFMVRYALISQRIQKQR